MFRTVQETGDHGSFNSWGRDRFWVPTTGVTAREVPKDPNLPFLDVIEPITIRNSRWRCDHGWDIDLDDGSSNYIITENLLLNGGLKLREGYRRTVTNNILVNNSLHPHVTKGVAVERIDDRSPLGLPHGLQKGDLILELNGSRITGIEALRSVIDSVKGGELTCASSATSEKRVRT